MNGLLSAMLMLVFLLSAVPPASATPPALRCTAPDEVTRFKVTLPHTAHAIRRGTALVIVAIGSSSTQGVGASDPTHTYPALLAEELQRRWPRLAVTVLNKGIGGETAEQMRGHDALAHLLSARCEPVCHWGQRCGPGLDHRASLRDSRQ